MAKKDKTAKELEGEVITPEKEYGSLRSAKDHLNTAVDDVKQFIDQDFPNLARGAVDKVDETVTSSISKVADAMINVKERVKKKGE